MTIELLINVVARGALGLLASVVFTFLMWRTTESTFDFRAMGQGWFFIVQATMVGVAAAIPTVFAWWNTQSSRRVHMVSVAVILIAAVAGAWLVNEIRGVETYYALIRGVRRVPVYSLTHMFVGMMLGAVFVGNAVGAALYLYRVIRHREA